MNDNLHRDDGAFDPVPQFATADDVALAERLRREIERRYLDPDATAGNDNARDERALKKAA